MMDDMWGHVKLYLITLMILNDILLSPWMHNSQARALLKSRAAVILDEQGFAYGLPMEEESKSKFREPLLGLFGDLLTEFADDDFADKIDGCVLLGLAFDYYFGITPPSQDDESPIGANIILLKYSRESFGTEPAPYLHDVLVQHGEKHIADRYSGLVENAGETQLLSSHSLWELLARLIGAKPLQMRLLKDAKVHMSVMTNTWKEAYEDQELPPEIARRVLIPITQIIAEIEAPLKPSFVQDLLQTNLILLFGRALLAEKDITVWIEDIRGIVKTLVTYCQLQSHAKSELAQLEWIHVWRCLNSSRRSTPTVYSTVRCGLRWGFGSSWVVKFWTFAWIGIGQVHRTHRTSKLVGGSNARALEMSGEVGGIPRFFPRVARHVTRLLTVAPSARSLTGRREIIRKSASVWLRPVMNFDQNRIP